jgi:hypothetical protein
MKTYTKEELAEVLRLHSCWLANSANLARANLTDANLARANLAGANLARANLTDANLEITPVLLSQRTIVPEVGSFIGFKKVLNADGCGVVIRLEVPAEAKRVGGVIGRKCRVECAKVIAVEGDSTETRFTSTFDRHFIYELGQTVRSVNYDEDPINECAPGIHLFLTKKEAEDYCL